MNKKLHLLLILFISISIVSAQDKAASKGKVIGKVFFNYHLDGTKGVEKTNAFELTRAYLGYKYKIDDKFSATVILDAGKAIGGSDHSIFIKNAKLEYKAEKWLTFSAGIFGMKQFKDQESFWGYRYIYKSLADEYKFGTSADLGLMASIKVNSQIKIDFLLVNGEGYKKVQDASGNLRYGVNVVYNPTKNWTLKAYYDTMSGVDAVDATKNTTISNIALFAGYKMNDNFRVGAEYNMMQDGTNYKTASKGKDLKGMSYYITYYVNKKWNVFGRLDALSSNELAGQTKGWNYYKDGNTYIVGFERKLVKGVNSSVNYRFTDFKDASKINTSLAYFNLEFFF